MTSPVQRRVFALAIAGFVLTQAGWSRAATVEVDGCAPGPEPPYHTITDGVAAAAPYDTLVAQCGVYPETPPPIDKPLDITASGGPVLIGASYDHLWAGATNADLFDEPETASDPEKTRGAMLDALASANLRVLAITIDYRLELADDGSALPIGQYNDCILDAIDDLMVEAKQRGILLYISLQAYNWIESGYYMSRDHYEWRRCKTPTDLYEQEKSTPGWVEGTYTSPYQQRTEELNWLNYFLDEDARDAYKQRVEHILNHRNPRLGNRKWKDINEVVWAWALQREPEHVASYGDLVAWLDEMSAHVKSIDPDTYVALGTKIDQQPFFPLLDHHFVHADIYTVHDYHHFPFQEIQDFNSPAGVGGSFGKLLLIEEFTPLRVEETGQYDTGVYSSMIEKYESLNVPWMFWEHGYNFDEDDVWHGGVDAELWNNVMVPHATTAWNTPLPCACKRWRVGEMIDDPAP